jgi:Flp pilus assembly protein TadB
LNLMAQTRKKRQRKRRGTQGGRIDTKPRRSRPRSREEAKAQARSKRRPTAKEDLPPTWRSSFLRGALMAVIFAVLLAIFGNSIGAAALLGGFMLAIYVPGTYYIESMLWRRRERARIRAREE